MDITLTISILSSLVAAFLAHYFATNRIRKNDLSKFQISAYSDFLGAVSRLSVSRRLGNTENEVDDLAILNDSKNRILVCGNRTVIMSLIEFWHLGSTLEKEEGLLAYKELLQDIRVSLGHKKHDIIDLKISDTLFKLEPSTFSFREKYQNKS